MVKKIVACLAGVVVSSVLGCKSEPSKVGAQVGAVVDTKLGLSGRFDYQVVEGIPVVLWTSPDGKHVTAMRVDARWSCDISSGKLTCGPKEPATAKCEVCPSFENCPCTNPQCSSGCGNPNLLPGLHDAAQPAR